MIMNYKSLQKQKKTKKLLNMVLIICTLKVKDLLFFWGHLWK